MTSKLNRTLFPMVSFVALVALACTCGNVGPTPTSTPLPTNPPPATKPPVELPTEAPATKPPIGGDVTEPSGDSPIVLSSTPYAHPSGAFTITFPEGWEVSEYDNSSAAYSPDGVASVTAYFENAGYELDPDSFNNYVNSIEANFYGTYPNYSQSSVEPQNDGSTGVFKTLESDGVEFEVSTYYWQDGTTLFIQDWWVTSDQYDALSEGLLDVSNSMSWNGAAAVNDFLYPLQYTYTCPGSLCTFSVPYGWSATRNDSFTNTIIDSFQSPDKVTFIDNFSYDDGTTFTRSQAGQAALALLKEYYEVNDIVVSSDQVQGDGSERLDWYSRNGGYSGESFFETRGTTFLMLTWVANDSYFDLYSPLWGGVLDTYTIP